MKKDTLLIAGVALLAGLLLGYLIGHKSAAPTRSSAPVQAPATAPTVNVDQKINEIKNIVANDPTNRNAWVALGNEYFDTNQFVAAIEAYDKALALKGDDANILIDQGVMFRRLGWFDRALENFSKATEIAPNHPTGWFNLGVVYRNDLNKFPEAIEAWTRFLELNPSGPGAGGGDESASTHSQAVENDEAAPIGAAFFVVLCRV